MFFLLHSVFISVIFDINFLTEKQHYRRLIQDDPKLRILPQALIFFLEMIVKCYMQKFDQNSIQVISSHIEGQHSS